LGKKILNGNKEGIGRVGKEQDWLQEVSTTEKTDGVVRIDNGTGEEFPRGGFEPKAIWIGKMANRIGKPPAKVEGLVGRKRRQTGKL